MITRRRKKTKLQLLRFAFQSVMFLLDKDHIKLVKWQQIQLSISLLVTAVSFQTSTGSRKTLQARRNLVDFRLRFWLTKNFRFFEALLKGELNNNTLAKQAWIMSEELRSKKQNCFLTNIDKILKSYDINNSIDDFKFLSSPTIKQCVCVCVCASVCVWERELERDRQTDSQRQRVTDSQRRINGRQNNLHNLNENSE